jgi:hypothetical protein
MITPTSALIVVPLLSGRPQARQKTTSHANAWLVVRISFGLKLPALNHAALKTISKCSLAKANSAFSLVFALPDLHSASFYPRNLAGRTGRRPRSIPQ